MFHGLSKVRDLAGKVSNDEFNKIVNVAYIFRKIPKEAFNKSFKGHGKC